MHSVRLCRLNEHSGLWWWDCCDREAPGCDEGSSLFPADELHMHASVSESRLFFNAALRHHGFHGGLSTAAIHMGGGTADAFGGPDSIGE